MSFFSFLDPILLPLVEYNPTVAVVVLALLVSFITVIAHKFMTNQIVLKNARSEMKKLQKKMKQHKDNPSEMMKIQTKLLSYNKDVMKESFKPLLITFIPVIIIFGWLNLHLLYDPIMAGEEFTVTAEMEKGALGDISLIAPGLEVVGPSTVPISERMATFKLRAGDVGTYLMNFTYNGVTESHAVLVSDSQSYLKPDLSVPGDSPFKKLNVDLNSKYLISFWFVNLNGFWSYIILTVLFSLGLRRLFRVS